MGNCFTQSKQSQGNDKPHHTKNGEKEIQENDIQIKVNDEEAKKKIDEEIKDSQQVNAKDQSIDQLKDPVQRLQKKKNKKIVGQKLEEEVIFYEKMKKIDRKMEKNDIQFNIKALQSHFVFSQLSASEKEKIIEQMFYCENSEEYIFKYGDQASSYFIIEKGKCEVVINEKVVRTLNPGDGFGELALLYGSPRTASIKCIGICTFWAIDRKTFRNQIEEIVRKEFDENRKFIENTKFFKIMTDTQKDAIAHVTITQIFQKDQWVVTEGDMATSYYIIKKGSVMAVKGGLDVRKMEKGEEFGEQALMIDSKRAATVKAIENDTQLLAIGRDQIQKVLGDKVQVIMWNNQQKWAFERNALLCKLTNIQIEKCINNTKHVVFNAGKTPNTLVFVLEGNLIKSKSQKEVATKGSSFGEEYLSLNSKSKILDEDIIIGSSTGQLAELSFQTFFEVIGSTDIESAIKKNENNHELKYMKKHDANTANKYENLKLEDMICIKKLGAGQFGSVFLVSNKVDKKYYALKVIQKDQVVEQQLEQHLKQEKQVNESISFPFIMQFLRTYKDKKNIYFLVQYIKGMELFDVIREIGLLTTYDSQFYIASLLLCIEYLHTNLIIYRDIKPENIMVDSEGYMQLIDMGTAKFLKNKAARTFTIIGTPHYMAPEIITGKGYSYNVDLWSIGVCLYEFMCGRVPFAEEKDSPYEIYEEIIKNSLSFPSDLKDRLSKKIMHQLLNKQPEMRLGGSYAALKANQWFNTFDWDKLMERQLKAPYIIPKDKMIRDYEIKKMEQLQIPIIKEIEKDQGQILPSKVKPKDPNWDKDF